jgi:hypothetical protein
MFEPDYIARRLLEEWQLTLGQLPQPLRDIGAIFEECEYSMPPATNFDPNTATIENISAKVEGIALALAVEERHSAAVRKARTALAQRVIQAAAAAVPGIIENLQPDFDSAVSRYLEAVEKLPERFTADDLLSTPEIAAAHAGAVTGARDIHRIDGFLSTTSDLPGHSSFEKHSVLRVVAATTRDELQQLLDARSKKISPAEEKIVPMYRVAADLGLQWRMATAAEADNLRREIEAQPIVKKPIRLMSF